MPCSEFFNFTQKPRYTLRIRGAALFARYEFPPKTWAVGASPRTVPYH